MNRIILVGNGFDLAHGLPTKYTDFMDWYWKDTLETMHGRPLFENEFLKITKRFFDSTPQFMSYRELKEYVEDRNRGYSQKQIELVFKNKFFGHISDKACLQTWLDIENEYYTLLKDFLKENRRHTREWPTVKKLNDEFCQVKNLLEKYLSEVCIQEIKAHDSIRTAIKRSITNDEIVRSNSKREMLIKDERQVELSMAYYPNVLAKRYVKEGGYLSKLNVERTLFLNFNYTNTAKLYKSNAGDEVINIHGQLNSKSNPIIFGYGDELDENYKSIEGENDNDFLDNIKSVAYGNTANYRRLLVFQQLGYYQVFIMGHSCGNSDRTLLNEIFEHENCISIKQFYHKKDDGSDDFSNVYKNITRNFNNKRNLRDIVVNKTYCVPLPQSEKSTPQP